MQRFGKRNDHVNKTVTNPLRAFGQSFASRFDENRDFFPVPFAHILPTYKGTSMVPPAGATMFF